jgi:N4-gp56 family major capsid protein
VALGLDALRQNIVLARIVNKNYESRIGPGASQGSTVNVAIPAAVTTRSVTADVVPPAVSAVTPTSVSIALDQWKEAPFAMSDQAISQVQRGIVPAQMSEAIKSLANTIDNFLWALLTGATNPIYGFSGTAGTTPFASNTSQYLDARAVLNSQLAPMDDRYVILDTDAEANALGLSAFADASASGSRETIVEGDIGYRLGARFLMSQNVPTHSNTGAGTILVNDASTAVGDTTITFDGGGTAPSNGDIFTIAGSSVTYAVKSSTSTVITMSPTLQAVAADDAALTFKSDFVQNILIHRDCLAFASAPLLETQQIPGGVLTSTAIDENSGLSLRMEVSRQYKQYMWSVDCLYGGSVIRPELAAFIAG